MDLLTSSKIVCDRLLATPEWLIENEHKIRKYSHIPLEAIDAYDLDKISALSTPNQVLGVFKKMKEGSINPTGKITLVLDSIQDPGNLGTIFRSAEAAGASGVVLTPGTVEAFNSKVVRSSAGSMFYIPVFEDITIDEVKEAGFSIVGTSSHEQRGSVPFTQASLTGKIAVVVGNEAHGMDDAHLVDQWITIPHRGRSESLNVAMAATVVCFEVAHQRDNAN